MQLGPVLGIAIVLFAVSEILKKTVLKNNDEMKAVIPYICALLGAFIGVCLFVYDSTLLGTDNLLEAVVLGAVSGLVATGAFQIYRQFLNLINVANNIEEEVQNAAHTQLSNQDLEQLSNLASAASDCTGSKKTE